MKKSYGFLYLLILLFASNFTFASDTIIDEKSLDIFLFESGFENIEFKNSPDAHKFFCIQNPKTQSSNFSNLLKEKYKSKKKLSSIFWDFKYTIESIIKDKIIEIISNANSIHISYKKTDIFYPFHHFL